MDKLSKPHRQTAVESRPFEGLSRMHLHAAGVDIGAHEIMVCVPGPDGTQLVRGFGTYTADLHTLADWLREHHIETVAMESTGVYWIPLFEVLEACGFKCCLISATSIKRFPGRKRGRARLPVDPNAAQLRLGFQIRFGWKPTWSLCAPCCVTGRNSSSTAARTYCTCRRRYSR